MRLGVQTTPWLVRDLCSIVMIENKLKSFASDQLCETNFILFTFLKSLLAYFLHHQTQPKTV
jgi:hypothetical protein